MSQVLEYKLSSVDITMSAIQNATIEPKADSALLKAFSGDHNLRVLFVSHTYVVGINQGKLAAIAHHGSTQVGLLAPAKWQTKSWNQVFELEQNYSEITYVPARVLLNGRTGGYLYHLGSILTALRRFSPDILQVEEEVFSLSTFQMALVARLTGIPLAVFGWENLDQKLPRLRQRLRQFVLSTAKLIVAGNQDGADLLRQWGYTGEIAVMPQMGVDTTVFKASVRSLPIHRPVRIGFMGRLVHEKGIDLIFEAARLLKDRGRSFEIVLCGSGKNEIQLRALAEQQNISDQVVWKGKVPHADVPVELAQFDILVLPSRTMPTWKEQFGHVLIEAMSMGVPVVGSSSGEIPNVIGRSDFIFIEDKADELASILEGLIDDNSAYEVASQYGIERVKDYYTHERLAEQLIAEWVTILKASD